ncbi:MAG: helix-hairpin-helix domain-containing protein [Candidatus Aureabacteria bacterium]|nr:helix-hairpin-helix domain-containing protein [Candidatus Auribacterota bacterium]
MVTVQCWSCGGAFRVPPGLREARCPGCGAACRRIDSPQDLRIVCTDDANGRCSFLVYAPGGAALLYAGGGANTVEAITRLLARHSILRLEVVVGGIPDDVCMQCIIGLMKNVPVGQLYDPGFRADAPRYGRFLELLRTGSVSYKVVRGMDNFSLGAARCYLMRLASFAHSSGGDDGLTLCLVHGGNSFLLSSSLRARGAPEIPGLTARPGVSELLFHGGAAALKAVASPRHGREGIVLRSDGRGIDLCDIEQCAIVSGEGERPDGAADSRHAKRAPSSPACASGEGGPININSASAEELEALSGIGSKKAEMIVGYREANGGFRTIEEIQKVPGIGPKLFERNKARLAVR